MRVELDGGLVVLLRHGGVAAALELLGFWGRCLGFAGGGLGRAGRAGPGFGRAAAAGGASGGFAFEFLVHAVDAEEGLAAEGGLHGGFVGGVHVEGVGDAGLGDFDRFGVFGG